MGKRQRSDYKDDGTSSTESNDDTTSPAKMNGGEICTHIQKAIDLATIRKKIKTEGYDSVCKKCDEEGRLHSELLVEHSTVLDNTLWLCLKCGSQLCGRKQNQHALQHYRALSSDMHALAMNTTTFDVWCYFCNLPVEPYAKPRLLDIVEFVKRESFKVRSINSYNETNEQDKQLQLTTESVRKMMINTFRFVTPVAETYNLSDAPKNPDEADTVIGSRSTVENRTAAVEQGSSFATAAQGSTMEATFPDKGVISVDKRSFTDSRYKKIIIDSLPCVRGLSNLGNTCFFNAVLQCLARTPYLLSILQQSAVEGERVHIPGGMLQLADGTETLLPPIDGELDTWRSLTDAFASLLGELTASSNSVLSPNRLLLELTSKWPQFDGGDQHDSHELLRHLLESVRTDDLRRYQALILYSLGLEKRKNQQNIDETRKAMVKFYGEQISQWVFRPEQVFRGSLVSTLTCQDCYHTSSRHEYFLDISLPVCVEKPQPPVRRKSSPEPATDDQVNSSVNQHPSAKNLNKREREREKKAKRMAKHQKNRINLSSVNTAAMPQSVSTDASKRCENNGTDSIGPLTSSSLQQQQQHSVFDAGDGAEREENALSSDDSNEPSDADVEDNDVTDDPLSRTVCQPPVSASIDQNGNHASCAVFTGPEKLDDTPENWNKESERNIVCSVGISAERAAHMAKILSSRQAGSVELDENRAKLKRTLPGTARRQRTHSHADWSNTIAPRYQCEDGEYSVQSCFNNFTAVELMTGNNKVCCEACTERINGKGGKSVNTNATKQFLISVPPAVLILHLKRFQVGPRGMFRKLTKPVSFPFVLDIAPFCGSKVKRAAHIRPGQKNILYALYGIVEHSGSMHGGHYVAYVKVRPSFGADDVRWKFIPQGTKDELDRLSEQEMAKVQAMRMGSSNSSFVPDSDDSVSLNSSNRSNGDDDSSEHEEAPEPEPLEEERILLTTEPEEEEEGAVGYTPKPTAEPSLDANAPPGKWYCVSDSYVREVAEESVLKVQAYLLFYERIF
ncbi:ubiquitin carboxyl-terminal hydrolase 45 [Anopheles bellator]|uniref:ubiquitin carboxyl-terminal hydrolase 45 n=1 Tax=Anopheles bellator TaxID=139047 RepID=UPI00264763FF|nr:ubiquitin carboxyl-terminal hydrolase 45 [Anopheles bellator]XP_058063881.1 ubiquitin carboxyl-terminal hydrolase 45 [Anopheles bellator]XP_058063882.1 ubiquitin carboxyl-terminal hydrolase 45 [Anopheles bellator]